VASLARTLVRKRRRVTGGQVAFWLAGMGAALLWLVPFLWMISTSLKPEGQILRYPPEWLPQEVVWESYQKVLSSQVGRWFWNSFVVATLSTLLTLILNSAAGYAFARIPFAGREVLFVAVLTTLMMPFEALVIPLFVLFSQVGLANTYASLILPGLSSAFGVFLFRQFFLGLPRDLEDAGRIDGCNRFGVFWRIALPLSQPALVALAILHFMGNWNSLFWPLIVTSSDDVKTLPVGMIQFRPGFGADQGWAFGLAMAAATIQAVPPLIVFLVLQRQFMKGIATVGLKG
jgi:multiple sugar transport system permease protein